MLETDLTDGIESIFHHLMGKNDKESSTQENLNLKVNNSSSLLHLHLHPLQLN